RQCNAAKGAARRLSLFWSSQPVRCPPVIHRVICNAHGSERTTMAASTPEQQTPRDDGAHRGATQAMSARTGSRQDASFHTRNEQRIEHLRVPPQSIDAEQAVLGGLMLDP